MNKISRKYPILQTRVSKVAHIKNLGIISRKEAKGGAVISERALGEKIIHFIHTLDILNLTLKSKTKVFKHIKEYFEITLDQGFPNSFSKSPPFQIFEKSRPP